MLAANVPAAVARIEARALLRECAGAGMDDAGLIAGDDREADAATRGKFAGMVSRRVSGEPVAYILGRREFYGREFAVSPSVLIPRPETELLVEFALGKLSDGEKILGGGGGVKVLDLGTGCGVVGISVALERPGWDVVLSDRCADALEVARCNAERLGAGNVSFRLGDCFEAPEDGSDSLLFDLIVCNPPYVSEGDPCLDVGDLRFEPRGALVSGADGLGMLRKVVWGAGAFLKVGGWLAVEHGAGQGGDVRGLMGGAGFGEVRTGRDLGGWERVTGGLIRKEV